MQLFRKSRQTLVFNKFKTCLKNSDTRKIQYCSIKKSDNQSIRNDSQFPKAFDSIQMYEKIVYFPSFFNIFYKVQKVKYSRSCVVY